MRDLVHPTRIFVHCSDTENGQTVPASTIRKWHVQGNLWEDIGYHAVIQPDGSIEYGRPFDKQGAHVKGQNHDSLGFCIVGRDGYREPALVTLRAVIMNCCAQYNINLWDVFGHYEFDDGKTCPGIPMANLLRYFWSNKLAFVRDYIID